MTTIERTRARKQDLYLGLRRAGLNPYETQDALSLTVQGARRLETMTGVGTEPAEHHQELRDLYALYRDRGLTSAETGDLMGLPRLVVQLGHEPAYQRLLNATADTSGPWWTRAVCSRPGVDPETFDMNGHMSSQHRLAQPAVMLCRVCPVRPQCLEETLRIGDFDLFRAGMTPRELRAEANRRAQVAEVAA